MTSVAYSYTPHPRQAELHACTDVDEILYGGSAGGGKSRAARAEAIRMCLMVPGSRVILFRRTFPDLQRAVVDYFRDEMPVGVASYNVADHIWRFANGSVLELAHLDLESDVYKYQGFEAALIVFEELTQFSERQYKYLMSRLRVAGRVRTRMDELGWKPRIISTSNPGGVGHLFVKARFIDPAPPGTRFTPEATADDPNPLTRIFIPAKVADNPSIDQDAYNRTLAALDPGLRRALRDGDWDVLEGARFGQWRAAIHTIDPSAIDLPMVDYPRVVGVDWGISDPFVALWAALLPDGLIYVYREVCKAGLTSEQQVALMFSSEEDGERIPGRPLPLVMDPSMWARTHVSPGRELDPRRDWAPLGSSARVYQDAFGRGNVNKANNSRVAGAALIDEHLRVRADGLPRLLVSTVCRNLITTLPSLQRGRANPEDVSTSPKQDDHCYDALRYLTMHLAGGGARRTTNLPPAGEPRQGNVTAGLQTIQF